MKVLIVGSGGREHALAWACAKSPEVERVWVAPGNAGTASEPKCTNVDIGVSNFNELGDLAIQEGIDLTIVGPEDPLVGGIREHFDALGLVCFAPSSKAAQLEGSKAFAKSFMQRHQIPTADFIVTDDLDEAVVHIEESDKPVVIKANGLAAGKGVVVAKTTEQAFEAVGEMLIDERFGQAGLQIVIEEFLVGEEASYIVMSDGKNILPFASSQDHKPVFDGGQGPNTGGMGAYSPAPVIDAEVESKILKQVIEPTIRGMAEEGCPFQGFLYAGLMVSPEKDVHVVEFNCRFGDPEAQPVLFRLKSDLPSLCLEAIQGSLENKKLEFEENHAVGVVMASGGYPNEYETGLPIQGISEPTEALKTFHAGTSTDGDQVVTSGGRVLCIVGADAEFSRAREIAYAGVEEIRWQKEHHRTDIGYRVLERQQS